MTKLTDREKLYKLDRNGYATVKVPFNRRLLAVLGHYNSLAPQDKPNLEEIEKLIKELNSRGLLDEEKPFII